MRKPIPGKGIKPDIAAYAMAVSAQKKEEWQ